MFGYSDQDFVLHVKTKIDDIIVTCIWVTCRKNCPIKSWNGWIVDGQSWPCKVSLKKKTIFFHPFGSKQERKHFKTVWKIKKGSLCSQVQKNQVYKYEIMGENAINTLENP